MEGCHTRSPLPKPQPLLSWFSSSWERVCVCVCVGVCVCVWVCVGVCALWCVVWECGCVCVCCVSVLGGMVRGWRGVCVDLWYACVCMGMCVCVCVFMCVHVHV